MRSKAAPRRIRLTLPVALLILLARSVTLADDTTVPVHIVLASQAGNAGSSPHSLVLGGPKHQVAIIHLNLADVRHVLLNLNDLQDAAVTLHIGPLKSATARTAKIFVYSLRRDVSNPDALTTEDRDSAPIAEAPLAAGLIQLHGQITDLLRKDLADLSQDHGLLIEAPGTDQPIELLPVPTALPAEGEHVASLSIQITRYPNVSLFPMAITPKENTFATISSGHFFYGDQRLRLWGVCRHFWGGPAVLDRLKKMGFNALRLWGPRNAYDSASARDGVMTSDPGPLDDPDSLATFDRFFADARARGFFMVMCGLHYDPMGLMHKGKRVVLDGLTADDSFLVKQFGSGPDWDGWKKAITTLANEKKPRTAHLISELMFFDPRLREIYHRHTIALLDHVNPYTQKRYADDEAIVEWELNNEQGFTALTTDYGTGDWPAFFRDELRTQWCDWLTQHYKNDAGVTRDWGRLHTGETLQGNHVELAPYLKQRLDYPAARAADVVHFLCDIEASFDDEMRSTIRAQAKPGIGAAVVPVVFDTQAEPSVPWMFTESRGDAMSFGTYQFAFHSALSVPPALYIMDNQTVQGKPTIIYETQPFRPCPFRAEYPMRVAALAGWQDWDGVFWHYWRGEGSEADEGYLAAPLDYPDGHGNMDGGICPDQDPALCASLNLAGSAFLHAAISPAPKPVVYPIPIDAVYSYSDANGVNMRRDTFTRGAVAQFVQSASGNSPPATQPSYPTSAVRCGQQIIYDWPNGRLMIDTPTFKAYVGQVHGAYRFSDGIVVDHISTPFVTFAMLSTDGKPIAASDGARSLLLTAQFDARNTGAKIDLSTPRAGESSGWDSAWAKVLGASVIDRGTAPAIADPVAFEIHLPFTFDGSLENYDFALRSRGSQSIAGNTVREAGQNTYLSMLRIDQRKAPAPTPAGDEPSQSDPLAIGASNPLDHPDPALADVYSPLPLVAWGEGFDQVQENLRDSTLVRSTLSPQLAKPQDQKQITIKDASPLVGLPESAAADLSLDFVDARLSRITATFTKVSPPANDLVTAISALLGKAATASDGSVSWAVSRGKPALNVTLNPQSSPLQIVFQATLSHR